MRAKASYLADFFNGVEKTCRIIAKELDGGTPKGEGWHKKLLVSMANEIPSVRPRVLNSDLLAKLIQFLGFRHVFRQVYGFQLDPEKMAELEIILPETWKGFREQIAAFCDLLQSRIRRHRKRTPSK